MSTASSDPLENVAPEDLTAVDVMTPLSRTCSPFSTVTEAVMIFKDENSDMVPIVDSGKPIGVIIDRDVALAVADTPDLGQQPVTQVMAKDVPTVASDARLEQIVQMMAKSDSRLALVVNADGDLLGVVSWAELAKRVSIEVMTAILNSQAQEPAEVTQP